METASMSKEFVRGDNRAQETILIILVFIIVFFLIAAFTDTLREAVKKGKVFGNDKKEQTETATITDTTKPTTTTNNEPSHASATHELQWLLVKAGYSYVIINGVWGSIYDTSHKGMREFERDFAIPFQYSIPNAIPIVRKAMKDKGILNGTPVRLRIATPQQNLNGAKSLM